MGRKRRTSRRNKKDKGPQKNIKKTNKNQINKIHAPINLKQGKNIFGSLSDGIKGKGEFFISIISGLLVAFICFIVGSAYNHYKEYLLSTNIDVNLSIQALYSCQLDNGEYCILFSSNDDMFQEFAFKIINKCSNMLYLNEADYISVNVLEYIPYNDINIVKSNDNTGYICKNHTSVELNIRPEIGEQNAASIINSEQKDLNIESFYSNKTILPNSMERFPFLFKPEAEGYYRFTITINYLYENKKYSYCSDEYRIVYGSGENLGIISGG